MRVIIGTTKERQSSYTDKPVEIATNTGGHVTVGIFNFDIQVINITGDTKTTMIKFNGKSLL